MDPAGVDGCESYLRETAFSVLVLVFNIKWLKLLMGVLKKMRSKRGLLPFPITSDGPWAL